MCVETRLGERGWETGLDYGHDKKLPTKESTPICNCNIAPKLV